MLSSLALMKLERNLSFLYVSKTWHWLIFSLQNCKSSVASMKTIGEMQLLLNEHAFSPSAFFQGGRVEWGEVHGAWWEIKATALNHALWHLSNVQAVHVCDGDSDCVLHTPVVLEMKATFIGKDDGLWKASCDETVQDVKNSTPLTDQACFELVNRTKVWHTESSVHRQFDHLCSRAIDPSAFDCGARSHRNTKVTK